VFSVIVFGLLLAVDVVSAASCKSSVKVRLPLSLSLELFI
jgi:hypothetical protein